MYCSVRLTWTRATLLDLHIQERWLAYLLARPCLNRGCFWSTAACMWSTGSTKQPSGSHGKHASVASSSSSTANARKLHQAKPSGAGSAPRREEDIWALDDSDNEENGQQQHADRIAKVAAEAGLGRKASAGSLNIPGQARTASPAPVSANSNSSSISVASPPSAAALHVAAALKGSPAPSAPKAAPPPHPHPHPHPPQPAKDRARQSSYGFWERLSGIGAAVGYGSSTSSSGSKDKERERDDAASSYASSGYARFDGGLELEDNFDGTYSVNAPSTSALGGASGGPSSTASPAGTSKLLAPANIDRPSIGGASALSSGKVPTTASNKGKSRCLESPIGPPGAIIIGTPRARSPLGRRKSDIPRDDDEMREMVRSDVEDILTGMFLPYLLSMSHS